MKKSFNTLMLFRLFLRTFHPVSGRAQVFRCSEPKGIATWSIESHKFVPDGFAGVQPVVIVDEKEMTVVWGDSKTAGGSEKVWKAVVFHGSSEPRSAVAMRFVA